MNKDPTTNPIIRNPFFKQYNGIIYLLTIVGTIGDIISSEKWGIWVIMMYPIKAEKMPMNKFPSTVNISPTKHIYIKIATTSMSNSHLCEISCDQIKSIMGSCAEGRPS